MFAKRAFIVLAVACACLLVHECVWAQGKPKKRETAGERRQRSGDGRETRSKDPERRITDREAKGTERESRSTDRGRSGGSAGRNAGNEVTRGHARDGSPAGRSGHRDTERPSSAGDVSRARDRDSSPYNSRERHPACGSEWRDAGTPVSSIRRGIRVRARTNEDRDRRRGGRYVDGRGGRATIDRRPYDRRRRPYRPPAASHLDYDYCDIYYCDTIEEHVWTEEIVEVNIYQPILLPIGVLIPEEIDPAFLDKVDSLLAEGLGDERLVCILQMTGPFEGYELYEIFGEWKEFKVLRKLTDRTFIIHTSAGSLWDIIDHPLTAWIDEYRGAYKYNPDDWDSYQYTYLYLMENGCPAFVRELERMGIPLVRTPDAYSSCYCIIDDGGRVPHIAELWWVYEVSVRE